MAGRGTDIQLGGNFEMLVVAKLKKLLLRLRDGDYSNELDKILADPDLELFYGFFKGKKSNWLSANYADLINSLVQPPSPDNKEITLFYELYSQTLPSED